MMCLKFLNLAKLVFVLYLFSSCASIKHNTPISYLPFKQTDSFVIAHQKGAKNLNETYFETAENILKTSYNRIYFYPYQEYELAQAGWFVSDLTKDKITDSLRSIMLSKLTVGYLVIIGVETIKRGSVYGNYTARELQDPNYVNYNEEDKTATLSFDILDLRNSKLDMSYTTNVRLKPLNIGNSDNSESNINLAPVRKAINKAYKVGLQRIARAYK
ncbi:MAG: hypothetical protein ACJA2S_004753 [Cyclobacteriaceae bacterium]|jgi:hypothetical protein